MNKIGIIGGTGLEDLSFFTPIREDYIKTPYGFTSSPLKEGLVDDVPVVLLSRHGKNHNISPSGINYRANIDALSDAGCSHIIGISATGSLREEIKVGDFIIPDQSIDFTFRRKSTFFESDSIHKVKHTVMCEPFDKHLREIFCSELKKRRTRFHDKGTAISVEGPQLETMAEAKMFRIWGADIINMTTAVEAALAREIEVPYAVIAVCSNYCAWEQKYNTLMDSNSVVEKIQKTMQSASKKLLKLIPCIIAKLK